MTNEHNEMPANEMPANKMPANKIPADDFFGMEVENNLLPAWFTERMMTDSWAFGLLMITGDIVAIESISKIIKDAAGNLWLDAHLCYDWNLGEEINGRKVFTSPTSRTAVSINAAHVIAAFELADT